MKPGLGRELTSSSSSTSSISFAKLSQFFRVGAGFVAEFASGSALAAADSTGFGSCVGVKVVCMVCPVAPTKLDQLPNVAFGNFSSTWDGCIVNRQHEPLVKPEA